MSRYTNRGPLPARHVQPIRTFGGGTGRCAWRAHLLAMLALSVLAACGGGGDDGTDEAKPRERATTAAAAQQTTLAIASFAPISAAPGTTVTVQGSRLDSVVVVTVGTASANFRIISPSELRLTVPNDARSGRIGFSASGQAAETTQDLLVARGTSLQPKAPKVKHVKPTLVAAGGGRLTLTGTDLNQVARVSLGNALLTVVDQTVTSLELELPAGARSGTLTLLDRTGTARTLEQRITVSEALAVTGFTPARVAPGQTLTISGKGLDQAVQVRFSGGATAAIAGHAGSTEISVVVPPSATSGDFTVRGGSDVASVSTAPLMVVEQAAPRSDRP